jgi:hypothetical protein
MAKIFEFIYYENQWEQGNYKCTQQGDNSGEYVSLTDYRQMGGLAFDRVNEMAHLLQWIEKLSPSLQHGSDYSVEWELLKGRIKEMLDKLEKYPGERFE